MAKGFKHGAGGGTPLNFKVVGGTSAPSNPKENTIWVNTSTAITSWDFSATEPTKRSGNKNLILYPYYSTTKTANGITFTSNADGTVTANGTATAEAVFDVIYCWNNTQTYPLEVGKTYTLGGCPSGGESGYQIQAVFRSASNVASYFADKGSGLTFTADTTKYRIGVRIVIASGKTVSNLVFKPQLEKGSTATSFVKGDATCQVWFSAGTSSTAPFNALKKNNITVYPIRANQYVNGAWVGKTAKTYQNGAWVDWATSLYKAGGVNTAGWSVYDPSLSDHTLTFGTYMVLTIPDTTGTGRRTTFHTDVLDLTNAKTLSITMKNTNNVTIGVASAYSTSTTWITSRGASAQSDFTTHTFDVSAINSGMVALRFEVNAYKTGLTATFESVYLT